MTPGSGQDAVNIVCHNHRANAHGVEGVLWIAGGPKGALTAADNP